MSYARIALFLSRPEEEAAADAIIEQMLDEARQRPGFIDGYRIASRLGHGTRWGGWITVWTDKPSMDEAHCNMAALPLHARLTEIAEPRSLHEIALEVDRVQAGAILEELQRVPAGLGEVEVHEERS